MPRRHRPLLGDTADLPVVDPPPATPPTRRTGHPADSSDLPRGMVVRRRWRALRAGAGWSWAGLGVLLVCWGVWVVSIRGTGLAGPVVGLLLVLATAALVFVLSRLLGRLVLERLLHRDRPGAWPSHLAAGGYLTLAGVVFLQQTWWVRDSWRWLGESGRWFGDAWRWLTDLWPL